MFDYLIQIEKFSPLLLGRILFDKKLVTYAQLLEVLLLLQKKPDAKIGELLVEKKYISAKVLTEILEEQQKYLQTAPQNWLLIPNPVLRASISLSKKPFAKLNQKILDEHKQICGEESLHKILIHDLQILSSSEVSQFLEQLEVTKWGCTGCLRRYHLFNYVLQESSISCPVCRNELVAEQNLSTILAQKQSESITTKKDSPAKENKSVSSKQVVEMPISTDEEIYEVEIEVVSNPLRQTKRQGKVTKKTEYSIFEHKQFTNKKLQKSIHKSYFYLFVGGIMILCVAIFSLILNKTDISIDNTPPLIIDLEVEPPKLKETKLPVENEDIAKVNQQKYEKIQQMIFVPHISRAILQEGLFLLKEMCKNTEDIYLGDYYQSQARILVWLVWIDQNYLSLEQKKDLLNEARQIFEKAISLYNNPHYKTRFYLLVMPWMLERKQYQLKAWQKKHEVYYYENNQVVGDIKSMLQIIKEL